MNGTERNRTPSRRSKYSSRAGLSETAFRGREIIRWKLGLNAALLIWRLSVGGHGRHCLAGGHPLVSVALAIYCARDLGTLSLERAAIDETQTFVRLFLV